ncbi:uncharacterized protein LOC130813518 [Amaranthus tricolor]|uniref:uncharacterized protein LOC130813518 n=1 Tax=Amaranthus tricolor TaxID=29722 RepID=UPI00258269EF|nr:uncharacterized protein LOC130813518 [Amaranthus tricolor]
MKYFFGLIVLNVGEFWIKHGESINSIPLDHSGKETTEGLYKRYNDDSQDRDNSDDVMFKDNLNVDYLDELTQIIGENLQDCPEMFQTLCNDANIPLYKGCSKYSKLSALLRLYAIKARGLISDSSFTSYLRPLKTCFQMTVKEYASLNCCPICEASRYQKENVPSKVVWYFPIIPRFRRLYGVAEDAKNLTWHVDRKKKRDRKLKHPANSPQWIKIDNKFTEFKCEPRNLCLALASNGMNPFGNQSSSHSTCPVILCIYNLSPELCMKRKYLMLSMLISGPRQPGNDIDIYLAPLIEDQKMMWESSIEVFDAHLYENFSGYSVKGHEVCPICDKETASKRLKNSKKVVFLRHHRFLPGDHHYRKLKTVFDGKAEIEKAPIPLTGEQILERVEGLKVTHGKLCAKSLPTRGYKKRSIFFELPYWKDLYIRHFIDVMHIEKNVCESVVGTLLHITGKTKDGINFRLDYVDMNIRSELQLVENDNGNTYLPTTC